VRMITVVIHRELFAWCGRALARTRRAAIQMVRRAMAVFRGSLKSQKVAYGP